MIYKNKKIISVLPALVLLQACVGIKSTAFYTKSNVGVEVNASPANAAIDISRDEGVVTPQFEGGKTLPVLASFKNESDGLFSGLVGTTFATGKAAMTMAKLYDSNADGEPVDSAVKLLNEPLKDVNNSSSNPLQTKEIKPVIFSTKTSVGLRLGWANATALLPSNFTLGYNRQEMALLPVSYEYKDGKHFVDQTSLLATLGFVYDTDSANPELEKTKDGKTVSYLQYFATGDAASYLATKPEVRSVMINRLDPGAKMSLTSGAVAILGGVLNQFDELSEKDKFVAILWDKVKKKSYEMSTGLAASGIKSYMKSLGDVVQEQPVSAPFTDNNFKTLYEYVRSLDEDLDLAHQNFQKIKKAVNYCENKEDDEPDSTLVYKQAGGGQLWSGCPTEEKVALFEGNLVKMQAEFTKHYRLLAEDPDVTALFKYFVSSISVGG